MFTPSKLQKSGGQREEIERNTCHNTSFVIFGIDWTLKFLPHWKNTVEGWDINHQTLSIGCSTGVWDTNTFPVEFYSEFERLLAR